MNPDLPQWKPPKELMNLSQRLPHWPKDLLYIQTNVDLGVVMNPLQPLVTDIFDHVGILLTLTNQHY